MAGLLIFFGIGLFATLLILGFKRQYLQSRNLHQIYHSLINQAPSYGSFVFLAMIINLAYFMFMMKMHSRYAQFAVLYSIVFLIFIKSKKSFLFFLIPTVVFNLSYTFNQLMVYYWWYKSQFNYSLEGLALDPNVKIIVSAVNVVCLIGFLGFLLLKMKREGRLSS